MLNLVHFVSAMNNHARPTHLLVLTITSHTEVVDFFSCIPKRQGDYFSITLVLFIRDKTPKNLQHCRIGRMSFKNISKLLI